MGKQFLGVPFRGLGYSAGVISFMRVVCDHGDGMPLCIDPLGRFRLSRTEGNMFSIKLRFSKCGGSLKVPFNKSFLLSEVPVLSRDNCTFNGPQLF